MHRRLLLVMGLLSLAAAASAQPAADGVVIVKSISGAVKVHRQAGVLDVAPGMTLQVTDRVTTGADASAAFVFRDGTLLTLGSNADVQLRAYVFEPKDAQYGFSIYLAKGSAIYSSGKIGKMAPQSVRVETPTGAVGVRGTRFIIEAQ